MPQSPLFNPRWLILLPFLLAACSSAGAAGRGEQIYSQPIIGGSAPGCITCHSTSPGEVKVGPSHAQIAQRAEEILRSSAYQGEATSTAEFLRESILRPDAYVEQGFASGIMYQGYAEALSPGEVDDLVAYLMTLR